MHTLLKDLLFGARMLLKAPNVTLIAVLTLALGIGANSAIFSVVNAVLWRRAPYKDPERLVVVWETIPKTGLTENTPAPFNYNAWREQSQVFENLAAWQIQIANLTSAGEPEQMPGQRVSGGFFPLLGVEPMLGRSFSPEEDRHGNHRVVMLSHGLWSRRFGGDPNIIGRKIMLSNVSHEVIGAGLLLAVWGVKLLVSKAPEDLAHLKTIAVDWRALGFTLGASLMTGLVCGLAPAIQAWRPNLNEALKEGGRDSGGGRTGIRSALVVAEVALTLVLLIGAGLTLRSLMRLNQVDMGFEPRNLLTLRVSLPAAKYPNAEKKQAFFDQALPRLEALPGVESVAAINGLPVSFQGGGATFQIEGRAEPDNVTPMTNYRIVSPGYFHTMKIQLVAGRVFNAQDREGAEPVAVISEALARASWPNENPLGRRVRWGAANGPQMTIAGIVKDVKLHQLTVVKPQLYMPYAQAPFEPYEIALRTKADPLGLASAVRYEVWGVDKDIPIANLRTMEQMLAGSITRERFNALLLAVFACLALALALVGIYGVMSYTVTQSAREIGIRLALGARGSDVLRLVVGRGLALTTAGVVVGLAGAWGLTRLMEKMLFGVTPTDPLTFISVSLLLLSVALLASYVPARRATKVDPMITLRR